MGKFESYPEANALADNDITLYNKSGVTHKVTFSKIVNLIKNKIAATGLVTSITAGAGLTGGTITSSGTIKCSLKSETLSSLASNSITTTTNRQYAVGLDKDGKLSVNIPWTDGMDIDGTNAASTVKFSGSFTVGNRRFTTTIGANSTTIGVGNIASGECSFAQGQSTEANSSSSHSEGYGTTFYKYIGGDYEDDIKNAECSISASNLGAHAEGWTGEYTYEDEGEVINVSGIIQANGEGSHAEGYADAGDCSGVILANGKGSHAEGYADEYTYLIAKGIGSHVEGYDNASIGNYSHTEGSTNVSRGISSHSEGYNNIAYSPYSHVEGKNNRVGNNITNYGECSHVEGINNNCSSPYSHVEGGNNVCNDDYSHVEGQHNYNTYHVGHAEGQYTQSNSRGAHVEGCAYAPMNLLNAPSDAGINTDSSIKNPISTMLSAHGSHAEGFCNSYTSNNVDYTGVIQSNGKGAHAEGYANVSSSGSGAIIASGLGSHAEGYADGGKYIKSSGTGSHAEGNDTKATALAAHAEGCKTTASGECSHAGGKYATASLDYQFVHGGGAYKFNDSTNYDTGVFGIQPTGYYYDVDSEITNGQNGCGGTIATGVNVTLQLEKCAMYMLFVGCYLNNNPDDVSVYYILTSKLSSGTPIYKEVSIGGTYINTLTDNKISIYDDGTDIMFHLIRIM